MAQKQSALSQPRPARTVRRRRLQQRPPHLDGRVAGAAADPGQAVEAGPTAEQAAAPPVEQPTAPLVEQAAPPIDQPTAAPPEQPAGTLVEQATLALALEQALAALAEQAAAARTVQAPAGDPGPAQEARGAPAPQPELPLLDAEVVRPLTRQESVRAAIRAHQAWTEALRAAVAGKSSLDVKAVLAHERCVLGIWLAVEGRRFAGQPELAEVELWHRRFHAAAAVVAIRAASGRPWEAARLLEGPSYLSTSEGLASALEALLTGA